MQLIQFFPIGSLEYRLLVSDSYSSWGFLLQYVSGCKELWYSGGDFSMQVSKRSSVPGTFTWSWEFQVQVLIGLLRWVTRYGDISLGMSFKILGLLQIPWFRSNIIFFSNVLTLLILRVILGVEICFSLARIASSQTA